MDFLPLLNRRYGSTGYKDKFTNYNWTEGIGTILFLHLLLLCLCLIFKYISIPQLLLSVLVLAVIGFWRKLGVPCHGELLPSQLFHWESKNIVISYGCRLGRHEYANKVNAISLLLPVSNSYDFREKTLVLRVDCLVGMKKKNSRTLMM